MMRFGLEPIYGSPVAVLLAAAAIVALMLLVTPPTANPAHRRWLIGLRSAAWILLLLAAIGPTLIRADQQASDATLVVAVDTSRSMTFSDGEGSDRWTRQKDGWRQLATELKSLDDVMRISLVTYDRNAVERPEPNADSLNDLVPSGDLTDLGEALRAAIRMGEGKPLAGVVLMGDGTNTAGQQGSDPQRVVETLDAIGVPLWTVPIGPASDPSNSRDVAVESLPETFQLFAGNEVDIPFEVRLRGMAGTEVPVKLTWIDASGGREIAATRPAVAQRSTETVALNVSLVVPPPGTYRLQVEADPQAGELIRDNNRQIAFVEVREGGGRVLYLEGTPRMEQLFLRRALLGFPDLDLTYQWIPKDTASRWPVNLGDWFDAGEFDVYVIGDLDATAIGDEQLGRLVEAVARGAGLVMLGGFQTYGPGGYAESPLAEVLPIQMESGQRRGLGEDPGDAPGQIAGPIVVLPARDHPVTDLGGTGLAAAWQPLPPLSGANRWEGPKTAPGVQVLLKTAEEQPLLVIGEYGRGRTAALAIDSTYRWWRGGFQEFHRRFWRQLMLWMLARESSDGDAIRIDLDRRRFAPQTEVSFRAGVQTLENSSNADLVAEVIDEQGRSSEVPASKLAAEAEMASSVRGKIPALTPGFYRIRVRDANEGSTLQPAELAFQVVDESRELDQPMADPVYLAQLSAMTADQGGEAFGPDQIDRLVEQIKQRRRRGETTVVAKYRLGDGPASGWLLFLGFAIAISTEWWLRRRWGLA